MAATTEIGQSAFLSRTAIWCTHFAEGVREGQEMASRYHALSHLSTPHLARRGLDRRAITRGIEPRILPTGFGRIFGQSAGYGPTGLYVPPGDPEALRRAIQFLLDNPAMAATLGENGRRLASEVMGLDAFAQRIAWLADQSLTNRPANLRAPAERLPGFMGGS